MVHRKVLYYLIHCTSMFCVDVDAFVVDDFVVDVDDQEVHATMVDVDVDVDVDDQVAMDDQVVAMDDQVVAMDDQLPMNDRCDRPSRIQ